MPEIDAINERAPGINAALAHVPADATLTTQQDEDPRSALEELLRA
jgi:hypothetical protein